VGRNFQAGTCERRVSATTGQSRRGSSPYLARHRLELELAEQERDGHLDLSGREVAAGADVPARPEPVCERAREGELALEAGVVRVEGGAHGRKPFGRHSSPVSSSMNLEGSKEEAPGNTSSSKSVRAKRQERVSAEGRRVSGYA
jgi:hypothetical protein